MQGSFFFRAVIDMETCRIGWVERSSSSLSIARRFSLNFGDAYRLAVGHQCTLIYHELNSCYYASSTFTCRPQVSVVNGKNIELTTPEKTSSCSIVHASGFQFSIESRCPQEFRSS